PPARRSGRTALEIVPRCRALSTIAHYVHPPTHARCTAACRNDTGPRPAVTAGARPCASVKSARGELGGRLAALQHLVHQAVLLRLRGREALVALEVLADLLDVLAGVGGESVLEPFPHADHLVGVDLDVRGLRVATLHRGLVDQHAGVGQREPLTGRAG